MTTAPQRTFLGHPLGLFVLFFTEMWERFSFYGMRALLILYMVNYFRWTQAEASEIYKVYISLVYVTPILGGYLADRFLGNRLAVIIGAVLMAIGHFLMAFEAYSIFIAALVFLIFGNGFFKPNMSTQVGRLYPANDGRRDGAYTIFYMGINLGAFLAPIACGWLAENTQGGYHSGFTLAGIGMVVGLVTYLLGQPLIREIPHDEVAPAPVATSDRTSQRALTEREAAAAPTALPIAYRIATPVMYGLGGVFVLASLGLYFAGSMGFWDAVMLAVAGICLGVMARVCADVTGGLRDRVLAILALGVFVIFFWGAFEQAGNPLNLWADKTTNRYLTEDMPTPTATLEPPAAETDEAVQGASGTFLSRLGGMFKLKERPAGEQKESGSWLQAFNPVPTAWFQSINALAIFVLAPLFAWMWIRLDRAGKQPSIPMKMTIGLLLVAAHMGIMIFAAKVEDQPSTAKLSPTLPGAIKLDAEGRLGVQEQGSGGRPGKFHRFHAGRLRMDASTGDVQMTGVLPDTERDRIIAASAPVEFQKLVADLVKESRTIDGKNVTQVAVDLPAPPTGFDLNLSGISSKAVEYVDGKLVAKTSLADKEAQGLGVAAGDPELRTTVQKLFQESARFRVSPMWLLWSYILATLGELCLSPVGLSMVSKLAPAKYSTMLMGVWLLTSSFGNFAAGAMGEVWGTIPPVQFFLLLTVVCAAAAAVLYFLCSKIVAAMHGVT
jgi:proton-dependent oligopeptide transporter, POT family